MRHLLFALTTLSLVACGSIQHATLRPSQVADGIHDLDSDAQNPLAKDPHRVQYALVNDPEFDGFFKDSAQLHGTLVLANALLVDRAAPPATAAAPKPAPEDKAQLALRAERLQVLSQILGQVPERSAALADTGRKLSPLVKTRFGAIGSMKASLVQSDLNDAICQLQYAADQAPKLAQQVDQEHQSLLAMLSDKPAVQAAVAATPATDSRATNAGKGKRKKAASAGKKKKANNG